MPTCVQNRVLAVLMLLPAAPVACSEAPDDGEFLASTAQPVASALCAERVSRPDYVSVPNGCTGVPNWLEREFLPACNRHDLCYGTCNSNKAQCDQGFLSDLQLSCIANYPATDPRRERCRRQAEAAYRVVAHFDRYYVAAQRAACVCCAADQVECGDSCVPACADGSSPDPTTCACGCPVLGAFSLPYSQYAAGCSWAGSDHPDGNPYYCVTDAPIVVTSVPGKYRLTTTAVGSLGANFAARIWLGDADGGSNVPLSSTVGGEVEVELTSGSLHLYTWDWYSGDNSPSYSTSVEVSGPCP